jgi:hypothetical protein
VAISAATTIDPPENDVFRLICVKFSSGVTLKELRSIAAVLCLVANRAPPPRVAKRSFQAMVGWLAENWAALAPFLALVGLQDEQGRVIDSRREALEKGLEMWIR